MYKLNDVLDKLNTLLAYSSNAIPANAGEYQKLMQPLINAVNQYFSADRSRFKIPLNNLELGLYNDIMKRGTVATNMELLMDNNFPPAYSDLRKLFYEFECMTVSNEAFHSAWVEGVDELTQQPIITNNTLIDKWVADLEAAISDELKNIQELYSWLEKACSDAGMMMLWEDVGEIKSQPSTNDIANVIFKEKHFKECIETLNLSAYKPTYI